MKKKEKKIDKKNFFLILSFYMIYLIIINVLYLFLF